jgi:hypothetical protein
VSEVVQVHPVAEEATCRAQPDPAAVDEVPMQRENSSSVVLFNQSRVLLSLHHRSSKRPHVHHHMNQSSEKVIASVEGMLALPSVGSSATALTLTCSLCVIQTILLS